MFAIPDFEQIRQAVLRDTQSLAPTADISPDSDHYVHASRLAACATGQYAHQAWIVRQIFPDTADTAYLEHHAALRGITRRNATRASGTAAIQGTAGAVMGADVLIRLGKRYYRTQGQVQIASNGTAVIAVVAEEAGSGHNADNAPAQMMAAPAGISSDCTVSAVGGTDAEDDASLLARLLERIRRPPAGGNRYDYKNWALSVDGVTSAYVYPLRRGLGTVDIVITSGNGLPSRELIAKTQAYIDEVRPVTAKNALVLAPEIVKIDVSLAVKWRTGTLDQIRAEVQAALQGYFDTLRPADPAIVSQMEAAVSNLPNITDRRIIAPTANRIAADTGTVQWFKLGRTEVSAL